MRRRSKDQGSSSMSYTCFVPLMAHRSPAQQPAVGRGEPRPHGGPEGQPDEDHGAEDSLRTIQR
jgi:hypothetical protein